MATRTLVVAERAARVEARPVRSRSVGHALVRALRPRQWTKNGLIFIALAFSLKLNDVAEATQALAAFACFCALSSSGYVLNDILDVDADRRHPKKRHRPIASGQLPIALAAMLSVVLALGGVLGALLIRPQLALVAIAYLIVTASYTAWLKHLVLLDIFGIAAGFVLRAGAGAVAIDVPISPWLYVATLLGALLIALGKRRAELEILGETAGAHRRNLDAYSLELIDQLILIIAGASVMTYALYTFSSEALPKNHSMMLTIPVMLYGLFRYLFLIRASTAGGAPEELLYSDRPLMAAAMLWVVLAVAILYLGQQI